MKRTLFSVMLAAMLLLCGCSTAEEEPVAPTAVDFGRAGMTVTLTDEFFEKEHMGYTVCYSSADLAVFVLKEEYTLFENTDFSSATSLEEYAGLVWSANQFAGNVPLVSDGDLKYFEYDYAANGNNYTYRTYVFKDAEGFWLVQFASLTDRYEALKDTMHGYAATVTFEAPYAETEAP